MQSRMKLKSMPEIAASRSRCSTVICNSSSSLIDKKWQRITTKWRVLHWRMRVPCGSCAMSPVLTLLWRWGRSLLSSLLRATICCKDRVPTYYGLCAGGVTRWPLSVVRCEHHSKIIWMKHAEILCSTQNRNVRTIYMYCVLLCPAASRC